ncbi:DUF1127 domain-containing protein [Labrys miyagiensis]|uniref:DUF1127 domain-containing protein n=1 Tax=Labrys miyagiensis TaxID=346912 RepID=UPI003D6733EB
MPQKGAGRNPVRWLIKTFKWGVSAYRDWRNGRRMATVLSSMNEVMLNDIGLSRCQITSAVRVGPSTGLTDMSDEADRLPRALSQRPPSPLLECALWTWFD